MANVTIKKYNSGVWDTIYPKTTIAQVINLSTSLANMQSDINGKLAASDISAWAKAATKPSYTLAEIGAQAAGTYNTIIGTDSDIAASSGSKVVSTINMTDGVVQSHSTRNLDAVRGQNGSDIKFWTGSQLSYNALVVGGTIDSNTIYFVTG